MGWAANYITKLMQGETIQFRPKGNSMTPRIRSGQLVTVVPRGVDGVSIGDVVLCHVRGREYLHKVIALKDDMVQIGNNHGKINGWTPLHKIYGICRKVEA